MRIGLIYLGRHGPGGPISLELASHLAKKAELFAVVSKDADHIANWHQSGIPVLEVSTFKTRVQAMLSLVGTSRVRDLAQQIRSFKPDVLLCPMVHPWTPELQKRLSRIPAVTTVHDPAAHPGVTHWMSSLWEKRSARLASRCVVLGETFVEHMKAQGIDAQKIDVIPHAIFSFYDRFAQTAPAARAPRSLLFFGRITEYKGLDVLIRAFQMSQVRTPDLQLHIIGEGDMRPYGHLLAAARNVTVVNRWVSDEEVPEIFQSADIVVVPYTSASQSGVIALAASFGRPVIATRVGAISEQIQDGKTGLLVQPRDADVLSSAIDRLLADHELRNQIGRNLSAAMRAKCNWEVTSDAYLESCRKAMTHSTSQEKPGKRDQ
jgi:glycosyltransferase involved in cell wall biosynthesis